MSENEKQRLGNDKVYSAMRAVAHSRAVQAVRAEWRVDSGEADHHVSTDGD